jgi:hypothetical protein
MNAVYSFSLVNLLPHPETFATSNERTMVSMCTNTNALFLMREEKSNVELFQITNTEKCKTPRAISSMK